MRGIWGLGAVGLLTGAASSAFAADLPVKAPPPLLPLPVYNWTGFYIGGNLGGAWSSATLTDNPTGASISGSNSGFIGGGQIGYNWQVSPQFVLGVEWMFDGTNLHKTSNTVNILGNDFQATANTDWITTIAGRFGYAMNNWLFYAKGGGGWAQNSATVTNVTQGLSVGNTNTNAGWLVGGGIEYGLTPNWTMKAEYDYLGLNNWNIDVGAERFSVKRQINMFTVGLNYKF